MEMSWTYFDKNAYEPWRQQTVDITVNVQSIFCSHVYFFGSNFPQKIDLAPLLTLGRLSVHIIMYVCPVVLSCTADEVPAAAAEVPGILGGREGPGGPAGPQSRAHASQVQHGANPCSEWVSSPGYSGILMLKWQP